MRDGDGGPRRSWMVKNRNWSFVCRSHSKKGSEQEDVGPESARSITRGSATRAALRRDASGGAALAMPDGPLATPRCSAAIRSGPVRGASTASTSLVGRLNHSIYTTKSPLVLLV